MDITVSESSDIGHSLACLNLLPEGIAEDIILAEDGDNLVILDDLQRSGDNEAEIVNTLPSVIKEVPRSTKSRDKYKDVSLLQWSLVSPMCHREMHRQSSETSIARKSESRVLVENLK